MDVNNGLLLLTKVIVIILVYMINVLLLLTKIMTITRGVHYSTFCFYCVRVITLL